MAQHFSQKWLWHSPQPPAILLNFEFWSFRRLAIPSWRWAAAPQPPDSYSPEGEQAKDKRSVPRWLSVFHLGTVSVQSLSPVWLCDPMDCSPPGSSVHGIFQARVLKWVAISFCRGSSWPRYRTQVSSIAGRGALPSEPPEKPHILDTYTLMSEIFPSVIDLFIIIYCSLSLSTLF